MEWVSLLIVFLMIMASYFIIYVVPFLILIVILLSIIRWSENTNRNVIRIVTYIILIGVIVFFSIALGSRKI